MIYMIKVPKGADLDCLCHNVQNKCIMTDEIYSDTFLHLNLYMQNNTKWQIHII